MILGSFGKPGWSPSQIPDLYGRVAIVTGANSGVGFTTALELARHGAKTYLACRDPTRAASAIERIKALVPDSDPQFLKLDLTSLNSATSAAYEFLKLENRLDILVNNAGIAFTPYELSQEDGIELQACNGTGHFAFTVPLLGVLENTSQEEGSSVRIVNVTSVAHWIAWNADFSSLASLNQSSYGAVGRYANSKLSNILFTQELQKRLQHTKIICISVHPGGVNTEIYKGAWKSRPYLSFLSYLKSWFLFSPEKGAITQLYAATDPEVETKQLKAAYLVPFAEIGTKSNLSEDKDGTLGDQFWNLCEALVRQKVKES